MTAFQIICGLVAVNSLIAGSTLLACAWLRDERSRLPIT